MVRPASRRDLIRKLRALGFEGPFQGGNHQFMRRGGRRLPIPNPHRGGDISGALLSRILREADITEDEWDRA